MDYFTGDTGGLLHFSAPAAMSAPQRTSTSSSMFGEVLRRDITPVIMVLTTPEADSICAKDNLSFVDLLRPHAHLRNINVPVRTSSEQPYRLQDLHVRPYEAAEIKQPRAEVAEEYLTEIVTDVSDSEELQPASIDLPAMVAMAHAETPESWYQRYMREFVRSLRFSEHETVDHPVACILVVASSAKDPVAAFKELYSTQRLPVLLTEGIMDPAMHKHFVLLHDLQEGPRDSAEEKMAGVQSTYGASNCHLLAINSRTAPREDGKDIWTGHRLPPIAARKASAQSPNLMDADNPNSTPRAGLFLGDEDVENIKEFMKELVVEHVIPHMEHKIRDHNHQVAANRKGLRNQIKHLWFRKGKEEVTEAPSGGYTYKTMEAQIRLLADYAFMLRDYELALSSYRLLAGDFKSDKAWKHYGGAQAMSGICLFMLDQSRRETEICMESAYSSYQRSGPANARYATCTALWLVEMYKARKQFREAALTLMRASLEESNLRAGVLLEQAALCFLRTSPPMARKFGFHMVLAGNRYNLCGQRKHAVRVYKYVLSVYEGHGWNYIIDHCNFTLGRLSAFLGNSDAAVAYFVRLLACRHQPAGMQASFLREFLMATKLVPDGEERGPMELGLPVVDAERVHVHFEDHRTFASPSAGVLPEEVWASLEDGLVPADVAPVERVNWLDAAARGQKSAAVEVPTNVSVCDEPIEVDVEFRNPLRIMLEVADVHLVCRHSLPEAALADAGGEDSSAEARPTLSDADDKEGPSGTASDAGPPPYDIEKESLMLQGGDTTVVRLKVTPRRPGLLHLEGIQWILRVDQLEARGRRDFAVRVPHKRQLKSAAPPPAVPPHLRLNFCVIPAMPRLEMRLHGLQGVAMEGELQRAVLELSNVSTVPLQSLKLKTSHPAMLLVGEPQDIDMELPGCLELGATADGGQERGEGSSADGYTYSFPSDVSLEGGSTLLHPLWVHARQPGATTLNMVPYYEPLQLPGRGGAAMKYRTLRSTHLLQVAAALHMEVYISRSPHSVSSHILRVDVENRHATGSFWLRQVSCPGGKWQLAPLPSPHQGPREDQEGEGDGEAATLAAAAAAAPLLPQQLVPGSFLSLFFRLQASGAAASGKGEGVGGSHVRLGTAAGGAAQAVVDLSSGPLKAFHERERTWQAAAMGWEGAESTAKRPGEDLVDVVLMYEQPRAAGEGAGSAISGSSPRFGTLHVCHRSAAQRSPVQWVMEGPRCVWHDFGSRLACCLPVLLTDRKSVV